MAVEYSGYAGPFYCFFCAFIGGARLPILAKRCEGIRVCVPSRREELKDFSQPARPRY